jgi:hypothetical protein
MMDEPFHGRQKVVVDEVVHAKHFIRADPKTAKDGQNLQFCVRHDQLLGKAIRPATAVLPSRRALLIAECATGDAFSMTDGACANEGQRRFFSRFTSLFSRLAPNFAAKRCSQRPPEEQSGVGISA